MSIMTGGAQRVAGIGRSILTQSWLVIAVVILWWVVSSAIVTPLVPSLPQILDALVKDVSGGVLLSNLAYSLSNFVIAVVLACLVGISLGVALGLSRVTYQVLDPLLQYLRSIPKVALVPLFVVFLGIGREPKIVVIALACLWPILLNAADGIRSIHPLIRDVQKAYRVPPRVALFRVILPAIAPQVFAGIRVALGLGVILLVVSEMYGATEGIGFSILQAGRSFQLPETWARTVALGIVGYGISLVFELIERKVLAWHFSARKTS